MAKQSILATAREWLAKDVDELRVVWNDLKPNEDDTETERHFFGRLLSPEEAGIVFERWTLEAFRLSGAVGHHAFVVPMPTSGQAREQIDGLIVTIWQGFLVECKFWTGKVDYDPIAVFHTLLGNRPVGIMGLMFSALGYTDPALESVRLLQPQRVLLFDRKDLAWALPPTTLVRGKATKAFSGRMMEMVRRKWILALQTGFPAMLIASDLGLFNEQE